MNLANISAIVGIVSALASVGWWLYQRWLPYQRVSWRTAENTAKAIARQLALDKYMPTLILGIGRGGAIYGSLISGALGHVPLLVIDRKYEWKEIGRVSNLMLPVKIQPEYLERVLLTAGAAHSGGTMRKYHEYLEHMGAKQIKRAVLFLEEGSPIPVEYYGIKSSKKSTRLPWMFSKDYIRDDRDPNNTLKRPAAFKLKVYFVRHAETEAGEHIFLGQSDSALTVKGVEQAINLGQSFFGKKVSAVYSSQLGRAQKTAKIINSFLNADFNTSEEINEIAFGKWEGVKREEIIRTQKSLYTKWDREPARYLPPDSETPSAVAERMTAFLERVRVRFHHSEEAEVVVVSHKTAIRILYASMVHNSLDSFRTLSVKNTEPIVFTLANDKWTIERLEM